MFLAFKGLSHQAVRQIDKHSKPKLVIPNTAPAFCSIIGIAIQAVKQPGKKIMLTQDSSFH